MDWYEVFFVLECEQHSMILDVVTNTVNLGNGAVWIGRYNHLGGATAAGVGAEKRLRAQGLAGQAVVLASPAANPLKLAVPVRSTLAARTAIADPWAEEVQAQQKQRRRR